MVWRLQGQGVQKASCISKTTSSSAFFRCIWECGGTGRILSPWSDGRVRSRIAFGGREFLRDSGGIGFWHETYFMRGGIEAVYDDLARPTGLLSFAPNVAAVGPMFSSRQRAHLAGTASVPPPVAESELRDR